MPLLIEKVFRGENTSSLRTYSGDYEMFAGIPAPSELRVYVLRPVIADDLAKGQKGQPC